MRTFKVYDTATIGVQHLNLETGLPERPGNMLELEIISRINQLDNKMDDLLSGFAAFQKELERLQNVTPHIPWWSRFGRWIKSFFKGD